MLNFYNSLSRIGKCYSTITLFGSAEGQELIDNIENLDDLSDLTKDEIVDAIGKPTEIEEVDDDSFIYTWKTMNYSISMEFDSFEDFIEIVCESKT